MAQVTTKILIPHKAYPGPPGAKIIFAGERQEAAAYLLASSDLQTVTWSLGNGNGSTNNQNNSFVGKVEIQASLATDPTTEADWFTAYTFEYPVATTDTQVGYQNLRGNYIWMRAKISNWTQGFIQQITLSY